VAGLIEREEQLAILGGLFAQAESGIGQLVFIGAEAGAGKSALVQAFGDSVATRALTLTGWCEPLSTPRPAGPLVDMAPRLGEPVMSILKHNDRSGLFDATLGALSSSPLPVVMVFEDVHWADETSLDLLRFLGRRIAGTPTLVIATYRDDEVGPQHPLRTRLGDLATQTGVSRFTVPALSLDAVAALASDTGRDARELWQRTGGNAFYVTELLRASVVDVPATVADAVIARSSRLSAGARLALKVAAIAGGRAAPSVLFDVPGIEIGAIDECAEAGFLQLKPPVFTFRHELVRQAVLAAIGATERQQLAAQLLDVLRSQVSDEDALARLAELAEAADDRVAVAEYAPAAARRAAGLGSHREAAAQYSRSLRYVVEPSARAELLESLAVEQYLTGDLVAAIATRDEAVAMRRAMSDDVRIGDNLRWLARLHWYSGDPAAGDRLAGESLSVLLPLGPSPELAMAMSARSQWFLLSGNHDLAVSWGVQALELATTLELPEVIAHASNNVGSAELALDNQDGLARLGYSLRLSLELNAEDHVSRAYVNLAYELVASRQLGAASALLDDALAYCISRDLDIQAPYLRASRALLDVHAHRLREAEAEAHEILALPSLNPVHRFVALLPLATAQVRAGAPAAQVDELVTELGRLARQLDEAQRLVPYARLRAEQAWLAGRDASTDTELMAIYDRTRGLGSRQEMSEFAFWLGCAGFEVEAPAHPAGPFREIEGAADRLLALGCDYDAGAAMWLGDEAAVRRALALFTELDAAPAAARAQTRLRELGAARIPRGPRKQTRTNSFGLTDRQDEVLSLMNEQLTNAQIAARLVLSERTVDHHVSAILTKLAVATRADATRKLRQHLASS
jgi:DNA-binding CsgD family transcriptional regulator